MYFIDANIFLELLLEQEKADECGRFLKKIEKADQEAVITDFLVDAIVVVLERNGKSPDDLATFITSLSVYRGLTVYFLSLSDRLFATVHMKDFGLDFDDATTYQAMKRMNVDGIVSFDDDFDAITGINRIEPDLVV